MSLTTSIKRLGSSLRRLPARFMAVSDAEWALLRTVPRLSAEVVFHATAILICSLYFGWIVFRIASGLLGYPPLGAATMGVLLGFVLGTLDRHVRIQSRGAPGAYKGVVKFVRGVTISIVSIGGFLVAVDTFHADIDRALARNQQVQRVQLEHAPQFAAELASARAAMEAATSAVARSDELRSVIRQLTEAQARELAAFKDEKEGNITGNRTRKEGLGPKARGHETAAKRLSQEIAAAQAERSALTDAPQRLQHAQQRLAVINQQIDEALRVLSQGATRRVAVMMFDVLPHEPAAWLMIPFWLLIGLLPDIMVCIALGSSPNDDAFAHIRSAQDRALIAHLARYIEQMRDKAAEGRKPLEVRLVATPDAGSRVTLDVARASNEPVPHKDRAA